MRHVGPMCKGNHAANVKIIPPHRDGSFLVRPEDKRYKWPILSITWRKKRLDIGSTMGIIIFTITAVLTSGDVDAETPTGRPQTPSPAPTRNTQPAPAGRDRRAVRQRGVLRCARFGSGQVRNAAPRRERWTFGLGRCRCVWVLPAVVLSRSSSMKMVSTIRLTSMIGCCSG